MLLTIVSFICVLEVIVFAHELGHFATAKLNGVLVHEFSLGMGPTLLQKEKNGTLYSLRIFLIGGYVKMEGEDEESDHPDSFESKHPLRRLIILAAGAIMNFVLAVVLLTIVGLIAGSPVNTLELVVEDSPAQIAGIEAGDTILEINEKTTKTWEETITFINESNGQAMIVKVEKADGSLLVTELIPELNEETNKYVIGIQAGMGKSIVSSVKYGFTQTYQLFGMIIEFFVDIINPAKSPEGEGELVGPIGMASMVGDASRMGIEYLLFFAAYISVNLGVVNLLPLPALDGGRILFVIVELIMGKPINKEKEAYVHFLGFALLMGLTVFLVFKDVFRLLA